MREQRSATAVIPRTRDASGPAGARSRARARFPSPTRADGSRGARRARARRAHARARASFVSFSFLVRGGGGFRAFDRRRVVAPDPRAPSSGLRLGRGAARRVAVHPAIRDPPPPPPLASRARDVPRSVPRSEERDDSRPSHAPCSLSQASARDLLPRGDDDDGDDGDDGARAMATATARRLRRLARASPRVRVRRVERRARGSGSRLLRSGGARGSRFPHRARVARVGAD
jgi:hypothetical protein